MRARRGPRILGAMSVLCPTPSDLLVDAQGRPYFLWDTDMTLARFEQLLGAGDEGVRAHLVAKLMRQAKPDDVFTFVRLREIAELWPQIEYRLGRTRAFWEWWLSRWGVLSHG